MVAQELLGAAAPGGPLLEAPSAARRRRPRSAPHGAAAGAAGLPPRGQADSLGGAEHADAGGGQNAFLGMKNDESLSGMGDSTNENRGIMYIVYDIYIYIYVYVYTYICIHSSYTWTYEEIIGYIHYQESQIV